uniref:Transposase n=1 Tax=Globodera rostochiensis TaxID=31243 RepID=A0A914HN70_GLORO
MEEFWILILVLFFATYSLDKAESVQLEELEELPLQTFDELFVDEWWDKDEAESVQLFDEIFGEGWWDNDKADEWDKLTLEQNFHHQIDRQNTKIGQIKPNSTDQLGQIEPNSTDQNPPLKESDHTGQIEPNSTDQNPPLKESDHTGQIEPNSTDQNPPLKESDHTGQIEPNSTDQNPPLKESDHTGQIEPNSTDQNPPNTEADHSDNAKNGEEMNSNEKRNIVAKFHGMKDDFKQKGKYSTKEWVQIEEKIDKTVAKELGLCFATIYNWKSELYQSTNKYAHDKPKELMKRYYEIKDQNSKIIDKDIAKMLKIGNATLYKWKKQFNKNSFDGHSVEENAAANVQEIGNSNSRIFE